MAFVGRMLQHLGLCILPIAMLLNLLDVLKSPSGLPSSMLLMAAGGFAIFWIGRIVEGYWGKKPG
jgi:hypothetical protein